ncbi:Rieske (2Fe-2S) protein [Aquibacillus albus]|uniref:Nitrite reductase/ring-hydroxylating ferredoxin subunit n=1 Tax=Aquibacillus albus TaxID=1168171 RepID=A0ABS2N157_9BACI|nr:Rieske (2Fe-2S) protein [Aquibacillus albus]MBM7571881.1 nitrite reductase/ring-hydroxylating ferredoxin subunit [Aquibacillus albus]
MKEQVVCKTTELEPGEMKAANLGKQNVLVCRTLDGKFYAFLNQCNHQGAPLDKGMICGATTDKSKPGDYHYCRKGEIIRCPWHGREFDIKDEGRMLANPSKKLPSYKVRVEDEDVIVYK